MLPDETRWWSIDDWGVNNKKVAAFRKEQIPVTPIVWQGTHIKWNEIPRFVRTGIFEYLFQCNRNKENAQILYNKLCLIQCQ